MLYVQGTLQKFRQPPPPLLQGAQEGRGVAGLVAWVGVCWFGAVRQFFCEGLPPPRVVCVQGSLQLFCQGSPPLLQGVQEGGAVMGMLARVGAHQVPLMARVGARGIGAVRRPIC